MALYNLRDKLQATCLNDKTQRLQWRLAFRTGSMSKEPQCVVTSLTPGKRMLSGINRSLWSQTRGTLSLEIPAQQCHHMTVWETKDGMSLSWLPIRRDLRTRGSSAICLAGSPGNKLPLTPLHCEGDLEPRGAPCGRCGHRHTRKSFSATKGSEKSSSCS